MSDAAANEGAMLHGSDFMKVTKHFDNRHTNYTRFMINVVKHIVEAFIIHRTLAPAIKIPEQGEATPYKALQYAEQDKCSKLNAISSVMCYSKLKNKQAAISIEKFLCDLQVQDAEEKCMRGCTWLELYILYKLRGGETVINEPTTIIGKKITADKRIRLFKSITRALVERTLDSKGRSMFKPGKICPNALIGVGILCKIPNLCFNIKVDNNEQHAIAVSISTLIRCASIKKHKDYVNGNGSLNPRAFKINGKTGWDKTIPALRTQSDIEHRWAEMYAESNIPPSLTNNFYSCSNCSRVESSQIKGFQRSNLDMKIKCGFCLKQTPSRYWKCQCGNPWHACEIHKYGYNTLHEPIKPPSANNNNNINNPHKGGIKRKAERSVTMRKASKLSYVRSKRKWDGITLETNTNNNKVFKGPLPFAPGPIISTKANQLGFRCFATLPNGGSTLPNGGSSSSGSNAA